MSLLNRQPGKMYSHSLDVLKNIHVGTPILGSKGEKVGEAIRIHQRLEDVDAGAKLYELYLECTRLATGTTGYIPTDFIAEITADSIQLSVPMKMYLEEGWDIEPPFSALGQGERIKLQPQIF